MTRSVHRPGWAYHDFGARDSYEQVLATIAGEGAQAKNVLGQTNIFYPQVGREAFPLITVQSQRVPLAHQPIDAETVREVQVRLERIEARILSETVAYSGSLGELYTNLYQVLEESTRFRFLLYLLYGIPLDRAVAADGSKVEGIEPHLPDARGIHVGSNDDLGLVAARLWPKGEPEQESDRNDS